MEGSASNDMNICIRTDASYDIGTGHLMRCLTLAEYLRREGAEIYFVCRDHPGIDYKAVIDKDFELILLEYTATHATNRNHDDLYKRRLAYPPDVDRDQTLAAIAQLEKPIDLLIVDHYGIDAGWERGLRRAVEMIMVIDDLANREHDCDILLDLNCHIDMESRYDNLVPESCLKLLGPEYALLREEFLRLREEAAELRKDNHLFVFFGGFDRTNETARTIRALTGIEKPFTADIIVDSANINREEIFALCSGNSNFVIRENAGNMAELMASASLAIGAGGTTTYERACLGLPALIIAITENQISIAEGAQHFGIGQYLGESSEVTVSQIAAKVTELLFDSERLEEFRRANLELIDGYGVSRAGQRILSTASSGALR